MLSGNDRLQPGHPHWSAESPALSGLPKQEYCYRRRLDQEITVLSNPRVHKALKTLLTEVLTELKRLSQSKQSSEELLEDDIFLITKVMGSMKGDSCIDHSDAVVRQEK